MNLDVSGGILVPAAATLLAGAVAVTGRAVVRSIGKLADKWENVNRDLYGEPARPGVPAVPGGLERLGKAEAALAAQDQRISSLELRVAAQDIRQLRPDQS